MALREVFRPAVTGRLSPDVTAANGVTYTLEVENIGLVRDRAGEARPTKTKGPLPQERPFAFCLLNLELSDTGRL